MSKNVGAMMKMRMLAVSVMGSLLISGAWGDDLPKMGYTPAISVKELVGKGYRWVTVNGYACVTEKEVRQVTGSHSDSTELHLVEDGGAYYLIPGTLVRVTRDDHANGMSEIRLGGITSPRWTYTRFLSARPIRDIYGISETPDTAGLVDTSDATGEGLRSEGPKTAFQTAMSPRTLQQGIKISEQNVKQGAGQ